MTPATTPSSHRLLAFLLVVTSSSAALANSSSFGGEGTDPMPLKNDQVEMVEEHVVLRFEEESPHEENDWLSDGDWNVSCEFTFRNTANRPVDLQVGFPFHAAVDWSRPPASGGDPVGKMLVWDFRATVRGKPVDARVRKVSRNPRLPDHRYDEALLWDVKFEPKETVRMKVTYKHGASSSVMGDWSVSYVLRTGALWKGGEIGRSRIEVHAPRGVWVAPEGHTKAQNLGERPQDVDPDDFHCPRVGAYRRQPAGARVERRQDGVSLYWDLHDFRPTEDLHVDFLQPNISPRPRATTNCWTDEQLAAMSKRELRIARNQIAALHGYVFESKDLREHFENEWWYEPDPSFTVDSLSKVERRMIQKIKRYESQRGADSSKGE